MKGTLYKRGRVLALLLASGLLVSSLAGCQASPTYTTAATSAAAATASAGQNAGSEQPGSPPGGSGANGASGSSDSVHSTAAIYISGGARDSSKEYTDSSVTIENSGNVSASSASGVLLASGSYTATGLVVTGNSEYTLGGDSKKYTVYTNQSKNYVGTGTSSSAGSDLAGTFDSVLLFNLNGKASSDATIGSSGIDVGSGSTLHVKNAYIQVDGARRYAVSNYSDGTLIVNNSYLVTTGNADGNTADISVPFSNEHLLISGTARTNFSIGATKTYYFNSTVVADGWAALSTDSASGNGLDLFAYNTKASTLNGGYGTYADTNCRVWLYGSSLSAAEIGAIIAKSGKIVVADAASAGSDVTANNTGATTTSGSTITGGRNAVMIHTPDMTSQGANAADCGTLTVSNSKLATDSSLKSTYDYSTYNTAAKAYVDYVSGDDILVKSTSADITLTNTEMTSYNGVLIHTVLNNDSMGNFLSAGDNTKVKPVAITMSGMKVIGNILHEDYQRDMALTLDNSTLTGAIVKGTYDSWKALWNKLGVTSADWLKDTSWAGANNLAVTLKSGSTWVVTADSAMTSLTIGSGAAVSAPSGKSLVMTVNGTETEIKEGTYTGTIALSVR